MENNAFVLLKSTDYHGNPKYETALHYGDTGSVLALAPSAANPKALIHSLRALANAIERGEVLTYERTLRYEIVDLPPLPTPIVVGAMNRVLRKSAE